MYSRSNQNQQPSGALQKEVIKELHYICPIENLGSVLTEGILSHKRASSINHKDASNSVVQGRRKIVYVQRADASKGSLALHRHAVFYLNAHNAMMYNLAKQENHPCYTGHENLCILRIHCEILDRGDAILSSCNASTSGVEFFPPDKSHLYSKEEVSHLSSPRSSKPVQNFFGQWVADEERKKVRMAEALLPYQIDPSYIGGIFVSCEEGAEAVNGILKEIKPILPIIIHPSIFFQGRGKYIQLESFEPLAALTPEQLRFLNQEQPDSDSDFTEEELARRRV